MLITGSGSRQPYMTARLPGWFITKMLQALDKLIAA
jgi:hypothetical protein